MQSLPKKSHSYNLDGAHNWTRTSDLSLTKGVLYHLSYAGIYALPVSACLKMMERVMGIEPTSSAWKAEVLPLNYTRQGSTCLTGTNYSIFHSRPTPYRVTHFDTTSLKMVEGGGFEPPKA